MFKVNNKNTRFGVNDVVLIFLLLTLSIFHTYRSGIFIANLKQFNTFFSVSIVDFEQVNVTWGDSRTTATF